MKRFSDDARCTFDNACPNDFAQSPKNNQSLCFFFQKTLLEMQLYTYKIVWTKPAEKFSLKVRNIFEIFRLCLELAMNI